MKNIEQSYAALNMRDKHRQWLEPNRMLTKRQACLDATITHDVICTASSTCQQVPPLPGVLQGAAIVEDCSADLCASHTCSLSGDSIWILGSSTLPVLSSVCLGPLCEAQCRQWGWHITLVS